MRLLSLCLLLLSLSSSIASGGELWPQWRGPHRDSQVQNETWPDSLDDEHLKLQWEAKAGLSYSGPIVDRQHVYITETRNRKTEVVRAYNRNTGEQVWEAEWEGAMEVPFFAKANGDWIRATPATDGQFLYVAGMKDVLICLDCKTGKQIWRYDFPAKDGTKIPAFGFVSSPLIHGDSVYVQAGEGFCRLNRKTGELIWKALTDGGGMFGSAFSSPFLYEQQGQAQILVQTRSDLASVDPDSGKVLWKMPITAFRGMNILTPTVYQDSIFTSSYGGGTWLLKPKNGELEELWKNKVEGYMSSPVVIGDYVYHHLKNQRFTCLDLESGESKWTTKPFGKYWSMIANGSIILALDEEGTLFLIDATPEEFKLLDSRRVTDSPAWAHVANSNGQVFIRDLESLKVYELVF
ncbi:MAG: PQQ-like beta-propeller repeat protein [Planctomycetaceae bacterium]|nr:PQQ-like beta-propeller repeat protein [Planctomycetaceae bacterium]